MFKLVIFVPMVTKISNFVDWNGFVSTCISCSSFFGHFIFQSFNFVFRIGSEASDFNLSCTHGSVWINNDSEIRLHHYLMRKLIVDIDTRQPTSISWMRVIPSGNVLWSACLFRKLVMGNHVCISFCSCIHSCLRCFNWKSK